MSPRRRSGAARRAKKAAEKANEEPSTPSHEVSTQHGTTVCEDEEASPFGVENEEIKVEETRQESEEEGAQEKENDKEKQKTCKKTKRKASEGEKSEGEDEMDSSADDEQASNFSEEDEDDSADEEEDCKKSLGDEDAEGEKAKKKEGLSEDEEEEKLQQPAGEVQEPEQRADWAVVDKGGKVEVKDEKKVEKEGLQKEEMKKDDEKFKGTEGKEHPETDKEKQEEEQKVKQPEDAAEAKGEEEQQDDNEGTVADEGQQADVSGSFAEWAVSEAEFNVAPSVESTGVCCVTDLAGSICEELFVSRDGAYGPRVRSRVFNEAQDLVVGRIPAAMVRYTEEAQKESVADACATCANDISESCFPAAKLFMDVMLAGGAAAMSLIYQYRNEILKGVACFATSTFKCLRTCVCTVTPPPQEPRAVERLPSGPWITINGSTEIWAPMDSAEMAQAQSMESQQQRQSVYADASSTATSPRTSVGMVTMQSQDSQVMQPHYRPAIAPGTNRVVFTRRVTANN